MWRDDWPWALVLAGAFILGLVALQPGRLFWAIFDPGM